MGSDCQAPYLDGVAVDTSAPWKISAVTNYISGWNDPVCVVCENKDEKVGFEMSIDQIPCATSKNCPKDAAHEEEEQSCKNQLTLAKDPKKVEFKFVASKTPQ